MSDAAPMLRPVSAAQLGIWVAQQLQPDSPLYNCGSYLEIAGPIDAELLAEAVRRAVAETEALRSSFTEAGDDPDGEPGAAARAAGAYTQQTRPPLLRV
ncbi:condensation domain-containing protein [Streptomyces sp. HSW2009]|uniref:condensation domain-containing protein n=1 Tax=Streptomyces sp. HSW2009 TaxID=3142890 RepID=UPI0032F08697